MFRSPALLTVGALIANTLVELGVEPGQRLKRDAAYADEFENGSLGLRHDTSIGTV
jgi:hypothetical protein